MKELKTPISKFLGCQNRQDFGFVIAFVNLGTCWLAVAFKHDYFIGRIFG